MNNEKYKPLTDKQVKAMIDKAIDGDEKFMLTFHFDRLRAKLKTIEGIAEMCYHEVDKHWMKHCHHIDKYRNGNEMDSPKVIDLIEETLAGRFKLDE